MKQTTFCAILLLATGCTSPKKPHTADPLRVGTIVVTPSSDIDAALYVGTIEEETSAALSFPVAGTLARTYADEGQRVQRGSCWPNSIRRRPGRPSMPRRRHSTRRKMPVRASDNFTTPRACPRSSGSRRRPGCARPSRHTASPAKTSTTASCTHRSRASSANGRPQRGRRFCRASRP